MNKDDEAMPNLTHREKTFLKAMRECAYREGFLRAQLDAIIDMARKRPNNIPDLTPPDIEP